MATRMMACRKWQEALLEAFLSLGEHAELPARLSAHLESCGDCRRYLEGLRALKSGFPEEPLYTSFLRQKALRRLSGQRETASLKWLPWVILSALLSLSVSFVFPGWILSKVFGHWVPSMPAAYAAAFGVLLILGMVGTIAAAISLIDLGIIRLTNGDGIRS
jgi:hypothetical protein